MAENKKKVVFEQKKRANTGCLRGILYFLFISGASFFLAVFGWNCANDILALKKAGEEPIMVEIHIPEDFTIGELSRDLVANHVIERAWLFKLYCSFAKAEEKIEPGTYTIKDSLDYNALVKSFVNVPVREEVLVVIPEGKTLAETLAILSEAGVCELDDLLRAAAAETFRHDFLEDAPSGDNLLEGYLYPDTYIFYTDWNPRSALLKMLNRFEVVLTPSVNDRIADVDYNLHEILTIASLIQMEAATISEMRNISSVIWNRLGRGQMLQIDATAVYLLGRENVNSAEDVLRGREIDSPYNTSLYEGLPPGPICSPGYEAIRAALYPFKTNYLYYALSKNDTHRFFTNEADFNRFRQGSDFKSY